MKEQTAKSRQLVQRVLKSLLECDIICWSPAHDNKKKGEQSPPFLASPVVVMEALVIAEATTAHSCRIVWRGGVWRGDHIVNSATALRRGIRCHLLLRRLTMRRLRKRGAVKHRENAESR